MSRAPDGRQRARLLVGRLAAAALFHVGGNDGGDDVAQRHTDDPHLRRREPKPPPARTALRSGRDLCCRLRRHLGRLQRAGCLAQWILHREALLSPAMASSSAWLGGILLLAAGVFQFTPLKHACLTQCRAPFDFIMTRWREGARGAFRMGVEHGLFCAGCCWALMGLLFVAGVMNIFWIAAITLLVGLEKLFPRGIWLSTATGVILTAWGGWVLAGSFLLQ